MAFTDNSPTDEWDSWGATEDTAPQSSDIKDTPDIENNWNSSNVNADEGDWNNWGNDVSNSDTTDQDGWNDWNNTEQSINNEDIPDNNFIDQSDTQDDWNNYQTQQSEMIESFDSFNSQNSFNNSIIEDIPVKFNFDSKKIAFIIAGLLLFIAIIFMCIDKIHINKKPVTNTQQQQVTQAQGVSQSVNKPTQASSTNNNSVVLVEIPPSTNLNYAGDILEANGTVKSKTKYIQGHQVLYCITINLIFGASSETINYYCNYASYNAVSVGDIVAITYQQVEDSYISINAISK